MEKGQTRGSQRDFKRCFKRGWDQNPKRCIGVGEWGDDWDQQEMVWGDEEEI